MARAPEAAKTTAATVRSRMKQHGIQGSVRAHQDSNGGPGLVTVESHYPKRWSEDEQRLLRTWAVEFGLTKAAGHPIDVERMTDPHSLALYL